MIRRTLLLMVSLLSLPAVAEQFKSFDGIEVHYVVVNTLFLQPDAAARYGVARGEDRAIVNLSVLDHDGAPMPGEVTGVMINLLSQQTLLQFSVVREADSIYYIAPIRYTDQDVLRFKITVRVPNHAPMILEFQQRMYVEPGQ